MNEIHLNEEELDEYLQAHFRFVDISEVDQDMNVMSIVKDGALEELSFEWDSMNKVEEFSTKLFIELEKDHTKTKEETTALVLSGAVRHYYTFPILNEPATAQVERVVRRLIENGCPTDLEELTVILSQLEREAQIRRLDTFVVHIEEGAIQEIRGNARAHFIILDNDTEDLGLDDDEIETVNGKEYYRYTNIRQNDFDPGYVKSVSAQLKDS